MILGFFSFRPCPSSWNPPDTLHWHPLPQGVPPSPSPAPDISQTSSRAPASTSIVPGPYVHPPRALRPELQIRLLKNANVVKFTVFFLTPSHTHIRMYVCMYVQLYNIHRLGAYMLHYWIQHVCIVLFPKGIRWVLILPTTQLLCSVFIHSSMHMCVLLFQNVIASCIRIDAKFDMLIFIWVATVPRKSNLIAIG